MNSSSEHHRYYDQCKCEFVKWMKMYAIHVSGSRVPLNVFHFISSLLESWIWLQWCWDLWKFCWWWSGLFQFKEVTEAMVSNLLHAGENCLMNTDEGIHAMQSNSGFLISPVLRIWFEKNSTTDLIASERTTFTAVFWSGLSYLWRTDIVAGRHTGGPVDAIGPIWF